MWGVERREAEKAWEEGKAYFGALRDAIVTGLYATGVIPVLPLVEIVIGYARPYRSIVSRVDTTAEPRNYSLQEPYAVCPFGDNALLVTDVFRSLIHRVCTKTGVVRTATGAFAFAGVGVIRCALYNPRGLCPDPTNPNRYFVTDTRAVRVLEWSANSGQATVLAGQDSNDRTCLDGVGTGARFSEAHGVVCTSDGATLIVCDANLANRIRAVDVASRNVTTIAGDGRHIIRNGTGLNSSLFDPTGLTFDRTSPQRDAVLFVACYGAIARFDRQTGEVRVIDWSDRSESYAPHGLVCLPNGIVLFSCRQSHSLYSFEPTSGSVELIAGFGRRSIHSGSTNGSGLGEALFHTPRQMCLVEAEQCVMVADSVTHGIRRVTLSPDWFIKPNS